MPDIVVEFGHFTLCLALVVAVLQCLVPIWGLSRDSLNALRFADAGAQVQFLATACALGALTYAFVVSDFLGHHGRPQFPLGQADALQGDRSLGQP